MPSRAIVNLLHVQQINDCSTFPGHFKRTYFAFVSPPPINVWRFDNSATFWKIIYNIWHTNSDFGRLPSTNILLGNQTFFLLPSRKLFAAWKWKKKYNVKFGNLIVVCGRVWIYFENNSNPGGFKDIEKEKKIIWTNHFYVFVIRTKIHLEKCYLKFKSLAFISIFSKAFYVPYPKINGYSESCYWEMVYVDWIKE